VVGICFRIRDLISKIQLCICVRQILSIVEGFHCGRGNGTTARTKHHDQCQHQTEETLSNSFHVKSLLSFISIQFLCRETVLICLYYSTKCSHGWKTHTS